ncbi:MAG: lamin tail domain-containing protein [candidate division WOR-3 bacterium]
MKKVVMMLMIICPAMLVAGNLIINEVSVNQGGWVELKNTSSSPINLGGWQIMNSGGSDILPDVVIQPGAYMLIAGSRAAKADVYLADGSLGSGLISSGDMLALVDPDGAVSDMMNWGEVNLSWKNYVPGLWGRGPNIGSTGILARIPDAVDRDLARDFREMPQATPGEENTYPMGLDVPSWGKIKALFSPGSR